MSQPTQAAGQPTTLQTVYPAQPSQPIVYMQPVVPVYYRPYPPQPQIIVVKQKKTSFIARVFWYLFIGWWAGAIWLGIGYFLCLTMFGLPIGLWMLNRLPQVMTLKPMGSDTDVRFNADGSVSARSKGPRQHNFFLRAIYFLFCGWWVSGFWIVIAYFFIFVIIGLPVGLMMLNVLPTIMTLRRNRDELDVMVAAPNYPAYNFPNKQLNGDELTDEQINFRLTMLIIAWSLVPFAIAALFIFHR